MAGFLGKIGEYDASTEDWGSYVEQLEHFFLANNGQKKNAFLACIGKETFGLLWALVTPQKLKDQTYEQLIAALTAHLAPKPLAIAEWFCFHKREQKEGESV